VSPNVGRVGHPRRFRTGSDRVRRRWSENNPNSKEDVVLFIVLALLLAFLFVGLGFAVHLLWIAAIVFFVAWVAGFAFRRGSGRWYWW
jgi:Flp pilus assembly protein TadB